ncbi:MAG: ACT domain-containing protein [Candidatus Aminicenantes bacterium]|nr:ACT domain-containing protein [Candidatus Aminicenantes bacterium]
MHAVKEETELHVIVPNDPGILGRVLGTMANAGINVRAMAVSSDGPRGHFYLLTDNARKAQSALKSLRYKVALSKVVTVSITDRIGAGAEIGALLGNAVINIIYAYGSSSGGGETLLVFQTSNNKRSLETLR